RQDLFEESTLAASTPTNEQLEAAEYRQQILVRACNFFYLEGDVRARIERAEGGFRVVDTDLRFTGEETRRLIDEHPERFSPNVALRPLYQECILPNVGYVGGPAEVAYWLQLKGVFEHYGVPFPVVLPRNFALVINKSNRRKLDKLDLPPAWVLRDEEEIKSAYLERTLGERVDLGPEAAALVALFEQIGAKAEGADPSLAGFVAAEGKKAAKSLGNIGKRVRKAEEGREATALNQISTLKEKLFPGGTPQERHDNFLSIYLNDPEFVAKLLATFDPFAHHFYILSDDA
ncbi:MAG: bacillithiol biosynthesis BshC, partial [Catalinimonas sp.]